MLQNPVCSTGYQELAMLFGELIIDIYLEMSLGYEFQEVSCPMIAGCDSVCDASVYSLLGVTITPQPGSLISL